MNITDRRGLKNEACQALQRASYDPKKLILIHTGATVVLGLILTLLDYLLETQIDSTGGLSGVELRSILETAQTVLIVTQMIVAIFWQIGYLYVAMKIGRGQETGVRDLFQGFRHFGPVLRLQLLVLVQYFWRFMLCAYLASMLVMFTPWADPLLQAYEIGTEEALTAAMDAVMLPMTGIMLVVMLVVLVPYYFKLRQAQYALLEKPRDGAMAAIRKSKELMWGRRLELFKLDISFWWFYGLEMLASFVAYGDLILVMLGVELPWSATASYYIFLVLFYLCTLALYWWRGNEVQVTYARAYEALKPVDNHEAPL